MTTEDRAEQAVMQFEQRRHLYKKLKDIVVHELEAALRDSGLNSRIHGRVNARVKKTDSFRKKIADRGYPDPLNDTRDLLGVRIVCLYPSVLSEIDGVIRKAFNVVGHEDKGKVDNPEVWRYSSVHYDCLLRTDPKECPAHDVTDLVFEIQVRTVLQDAWATVEHTFGYKTERPIPEELKREFSALAGLFHVADERFQFIADQVQMLDRAKDAAKQLAPLYRAALEAAASADPHVSGTDVRIEELERRSDAVINRGSLRALLRGIYREKRPKNNREYSLLAADLASAGITNLGELGRLLLKGDEAARQQEQQRGRLTDVTFARLAISAASPTFQNMRQRPPRRHAP
jgi:ppGpp synthetase/RelA/SpoT-type nucleotidyltranferase